MDAFRQSISRAALGIADLITPVLKESKFREEGVITPAEFVAAGDHLVHQCPTWHWASGENSHVRSYLPENKQYLFTKGVPCQKRFNQMFKVKGDENRVLEENDNDGGWVDAGYIETDNDNLANNDFDQFKREDIAKGLETIDINGSKSDDDDDEEAEDFDAFMQDNMEDEKDDPVVAKAILHPPKSSEVQLSESDVLRSRTYDLYITYDKYYRTARFWLTGFDEHNKPLSEAQMFEDFSQDHANKTITMEMHPHFTGVSMPSIHPCRQAELMKRLMDKMADSNENLSAGDAQSNEFCGSSTSAPVATSPGITSAGGEQRRQLGVHQYLMVFLKFVQSVIPTIDYDFTRNFKF